MKILVLATKYFGIGGVETYTRYFTQAVAETGATVEILSFLGGESDKRAVAGRYLGDQGRRSTIPGKVRFLGEAMRHGSRCDLVICNHVAVAPLALVLFRLFGIPYVVIGHGIEVWGKVARHRRAALRHAARVVAVSHFTAQMLATVQGVRRGRVSIVHPVVNPTLLAQAGASEEGLHREQGEVVLLTVARLSARERYKGCDVVIRALPTVASLAGPVHYDIVGDGDDRPRLAAMAREQGVAPLVTFRELAPGDDLAPYYRACDVFVMPSVAEHRADGWAGEGFGIVYIEAAAFGRPVIAGSGGGAPEAVQDGVTGIVVDGRDVDDVAGALVRLVRDAALRLRMGNAGRRWVREHFTFERICREVRAVVHAAAGTASS